MRGMVVGEGGRSSGVLLYLVTMAASAGQLRQTWKENWRPHVVSQKNAIHLLDRSHEERRCINSSPSYDINYGMKQCNISLVVTFITYIAGNSV